MSSVERIVVQRTHVVPRVGRLLGAQGKVVSYVRAVRTKDGVSVDRHGVAQLLDHGPELFVTLEVGLAPVQHRVVLPLQRAPHGFLCVKGTTVRRLPARMEPLEVLAHLGTAMSAMVVHDKVGTRTAVLVL